MFRKVGAVARNPCTVLYGIRHTTYTLKSTYVVRTEQVNVPMWDVGAGGQARGWSSGEGCSPAADAGFPGVE